MVSGSWLVWMPRPLQVKADGGGGDVGAAPHGEAFGRCLYVYVFGCSCFFCVGVCIYVCMCTGVGCMIELFFIVSVFSSGGVRGGITRVQSADFGRTRVETGQDSIEGNSWSSGVFVVSCVSGVLFCGFITFML